MKLIFTLIFIIPLASPAQYLDYKVDKLTGDTTWLTSSKRIHYQLGFGTAGEILSVSLSKSKTGKSLNLFIITGDYLPSVKTGDKVYIKFSNGTITELHSLRDYRSSPIDLDKGAMLSCSYPIPDDQLTLLKNYSVSLIRYEHDGKYTDYEIRGNNMTFLSRSSKLLFN